ncbi:hypothetical protein SDC9_60845 [bioreactor metagenome]|uniref:DUF4367 domain-containing protein n=1 Tax=bioreactor metagenome TaxID=1076179 RepID=A0A644XE65_9ZZZZ
MDNKNDHTPYKEVNFHDKDRYEYLKDLNTEKLQAMLQQESFFSDDSHFDAELIQHIEKALDEREPVFENIDAEASLKIFRDEVIPDLEQEEEPTNSKPAARPMAKGRLKLRRAMIAAAVISALLGGMQIASAFGFDVWEYIIHWGNETFQIGTGAEVSEAPKNTEVSIGDAAVQMGDKGRYQSLEDAVKSMDYPILYPVWIPDGFALLQADVTETPKKKSLIAIYESNDKTIMYQAVGYKDNDAAQFFEMNAASGEVLAIHGFDHYLMQNMGQYTAVWMRDNCTFSLSGDVSRDEMMDMLDSIYEEEN